MKRIVSVLLLSMLTLTAAKAQTPTAEQVVSKYIKAIGGAAKWKALKNMRLTVTMRTQGIDLAGEVNATADGKQRMEFNYSGAKMIQAYDGTTAWTINGFAGMTTPTKLEGADAEDLSDEEFLDEFIDYKKIGSVVSYIGEEEFEGLPYHKISMKKKNGEEATYLFDDETGFLVLKRETSDGQQVETQFQDYGDIEGFIMPMKVIGKAGGQIQQSFIVSKAEMNVEMADALFAFPKN